MRLWSARDAPAPRDSRSPGPRPAVRPARRPGRDPRLPARPARCQAPGGRPRITVDHAILPGPAGDITVRVYQPTGAPDSPRPGVLYFHGGAFISGDLDTGDGNCRDLCLAAGAAVVSVDYRLAPEHRYPAAFDDCYAALLWTAANAERLGLDPARLAVAGRSAGGALAAAVALAARDRGGPRLAFQLLLVPALDDRCALPSVDTCVDGRIVDGRVVRGMWPLYLGSATADPYAAPARAEDLTACRRPTSRSARPTPCATRRSSTDAGS